MGAPISAVEAAALVVMGAYIARRFLHGRSQGMRFLQDAGVVALSAWAAEDSCIRMYAFYEYAPEWHLYVDGVPLFIALIWPFVVLSARDLGKRLAPNRPLLAAGAIVWADATFIEVIATSSGLWSWREPGPFGVPLIAPFGWACFAVAVLGVMQDRRVPAWALPVAAVPLTHALLVASWWGLFRWVSRPAGEWGFTGVVAATGLVMTGLAWRVRGRARVRLDEMLLRLAAASVFFGLVAALHRDHAALQVFTASFVPPWMALMSGAQWPSAKGSSGRPDRTHPT